MDQGNGSNDRAGELHVEIIDDVGRVIDTIYIREITPGSGPIPVPRRRSEPGVRRRDD
jgi:hypothetical protein